MPRHTTTLIALTLIVTTLGCAAQRFANQGDAARLADRPVDALAYYRQALRADPNLGGKPQFVEKLRDVGAKADVEQGDDLARQQRWEEAVAKYEHALEVNPSYDAARQRIDKTRREGADALYDQGLNHADHGQLQKAIETLERALKLDPQHGPARHALDSVRQQARQLHDEADALYDTASALAQQSHWQQALDRLQRAVQIDAGHLRARVLRHEATAKLDESHSAAKRGRSQLDGKLLDDAIASLEDALAVWPDNADGQALLARARASRQQVTQLIDEAMALRERAQWDQALRAAETARELYPTLEAAGALPGSTRDAAAAWWTKRGNEALAADAFAKADDAFAAALGYVGGYAAAHDGLARTDATRADRALDAGRLGEALLWAMNAADHRPRDSRYAQLVGAARAQLADRETFAAAFIVTDADGNLTRDASSLEAALLAVLKHQHPPFVELVDPTSVDPQPAYIAELRLTGLDIDEGLIHSEQLNHAYTAYESVPNPEIPRIQVKLAKEEHELHELQHRQALRCAFCTGAGDVVCGGCRGARHVRCGHCSGRGHVVVNKQRRPCGHCGGRGHVNCGKCRGTGRLSCSHCRGSGLRYRISDLQIWSQKNDVERLLRDLEGEPATVLEPYTAYWPYTLNHHRKTGELTARLTVRSAAGVAIDTAIVEMSFDRDDTTIDHANPDIGLLADGLDLPSDSSVRKALIDGAAEEAAARSIAAAARNRRTLLTDEAQRREAAGDHAAALEARVAAAMVLEAVDRKAAGDTMHALQNALSESP